MRAIDASNSDLVILPSRTIEVWPYTKATRLYFKQAVKGAATGLAKDEIRRPVAVVSEFDYELAICKNCG